MGGEIETVVGVEEDHEEGGSGGFGGGKRAYALRRNQSGRLSPELSD